MFYKQDSTAMFFHCFFASSRCLDLSMTSLYFFRIGSESLLRHGTISYCTQTFPGIRQVNLTVAS